MSSAFELVDQQQDFIIVNKTANINFHDEQNLGQGLFNQICQALPDTTLFPVHRLDKMTSGLLILATNLAAAQQFQQLFSQQQIEKYYLAISDKKPKKKQGLIKGDMEKSRRGTWKLVRTMNNPAISQFFSYPLHAGQRLYVIKPHSGKSHQIRVALASVGAPIIGDERYHKASESDRGYLHAYALRFTLQQRQYQYLLAPQQGKLFTEETFTDALSSLKQPWQLAWPKL